MRHPQVRDRRNRPDPAAAGLVDELHLWVFPVIAGEGGRLLEGLPITHLALQETTRFSSGVVVLRFAGTAER